MKYIKRWVLSVIILLTLIMLLLFSIVLWVLRISKTTTLKKIFALVAVVANHIVRLLLKGDTDTTPLKVAFLKMYYDISE